MELKENAIVNLTFEFSLNIIRFSEQLDENKKWVISRQLLKCGTSIGANVWEAQNAESKLDFIHKLKIAAKEASEAQYWLMLCKRAPSYPFDEQLLTSLEEIIKVLGKIIATSKARLNV